MEQLKDIAPAGLHILISLANIDAIKKTVAFQITEVKGKDQEETTRTASCWNLIPSSNSRKRKNNSIEDLASKRSACQTADDVCQSSNFIDHKLNSDFALPSELPLDHQTSRSNNEKQTSPQNPDTTLSKSNERSRSRLLERITPPFKDHSRII
ncbi:hypothetical protein Pst134EB_012834 [Puccinia striiformis f. sp. tritici]|nr:hypothetical protein Pst134EB_012834 [Puccinia striiformis f. sp. tritici]